MNEKLLTYGFDLNSEKYQNLLKTAAIYNISVSQVHSYELGEKVGFLMGLPNYEPSSEKLDFEKDIEFIIFSDFDRKILSLFLNSLKENNVYIPHKSVITETTKDWTFIELLNHIEIEHRVMQKFSILGEYIKSATNILKKQDNPELKSAIDSALLLKHNNNITEKDIDEKLNNFKKFL